MRYIIDVNKKFTKEITMDKTFAYNTVKKLLSENGVEFRADYPMELVMARAGRISHFFNFTERSVSIISSVTVGKKDIETTSLDFWYDDVTGFRFVDGQLWVDCKTLGYTVVNFKQGK